MNTQIVQNQLEDQNTDLHECRELQRQTQHSKDQEKRTNQDLFTATNVILVHVPDYLQAV